jgi:hypothetical protein
MSHVLRVKGDCEDARKKGKNPPVRRKNHNVRQALHIRGEM